MVDRPLQSQTICSPAEGLLALRVRVAVQGNARELDVPVDTRVKVRVVADQTGKHSAVLRRG